MDIKQLTEEAEKLINDDMQKAIDAKEQYQAEMYYNWAFGTLTLWRRLASVTISQESDTSKWIKLDDYRDKAEDRFTSLVSMDNVPLLQIKS